MTEVYRITVPGASRKKQVRLGGAHRVKCILASYDYRGDITVEKMTGEFTVIDYRELYAKTEKAEPGTKESGTGWPG